MTKAIETHRFERPDDRLDMKERGGIDIVKTGQGSTGMHAVFEPGWIWEADEKPLPGHPDTCPMHHTGYCLSGRGGGEEHTAKGDFFEIPPGHDAYVDGDERVEMIRVEAPGAHA